MSSIALKDKALALLTQMSMPPKASTVAATARSNLLLDADVASERQRAPARRLDLGRCRRNRALELGIGLLRLGHDRDVGAIARGALGDGEPDAAACPRHQQRLAFEAFHTHPTFASEPEVNQRRNRNGSSAMPKSCRMSETKSAGSPATGRNRRRKAAKRAACAAR